MTIVVSDGVLIASDSRRTADYVDAFDTRPKFTVVGKGKRRAIAAFAGREAWRDMLIPWIASPRKYPVIASDGDGAAAEAAVFRARQWRAYSSSDGNSVLMPTRWAIGSGARYALAALWLGHDAVSAAEAAIALDCDCGGPVWVANIEDLFRDGDSAIRQASQRRPEAPRADDYGRQGYAAHGAQSRPSRR